jgi:hypothetical protein
LNSRSENTVKIATIKELHSLVKTKVLILRDLPFITRISKLYDLTLLDNSLGDSSKSSSTSTIFGDNKGSENQFGYNNIINDNSHVTDTINNQNNYDDDVMTLMQAQIPKQNTLDGKGQEAMAND